jgi:transcriptional regulator with XRE-family HTH domain
VRSPASNTFGNNVKRLRAAHSLTQEALAEKADVSRRYLQEIESGAKLPTVPVLARLRRGLGCLWDDLLKGL